MSFGFRHVAKREDSFYSSQLIELHPCRVNDPESLSFNLLSRSPLCQVLDEQPKAAPLSSLKKCCPLNQHYGYEFGKRSCVNSSQSFQMKAIQARFYENCIEDEEINVTIAVVVENQCKKSDKLIHPPIYLFLIHQHLHFSGLMYNQNYNDILYVIQNGSLLRIDDSYESYDVYNHYCLEFDEDEGAITAIVCEFDDILFQVDPAQALIFATCMIISVPVRNQLIKLIVIQIKGAEGAYGCLCLQSPLLKIAIEKGYNVRMSLPLSKLSPTNLYVNQSPSSILSQTLCWSHLLSFSLIPTSSSFSSQS